jgi:hypothetical protein
MACMSAGEPARAERGKARATARDRLRRGYHCRAASPALAGVNPVYGLYIIAAPIGGSLLVSAQ